MTKRKLRKSTYILNDKLINYQLYDNEKFKTLLKHELK